MVILSWCSLDVNIPLVFTQHVPSGGSWPGFVCLNLLEGSRVGTSREIKKEQWCLVPASSLHVCSSVKTTNSSPAAQAPLLHQTTKGTSVT